MASEKEIEKDGEREKEIGNREKRRAKDGEKEKERSER